MENQTNELAVLQNDGVFNNLPQHAIVTNITMKNGHKTSIVTLFNQNEFHFEQINKGVNYQLACQDWLPIEKIQSLVYSLRNSIPELITCFDDIHRR